MDANVLENLAPYLPASEPVYSVRKNDLITGICLFFFFCPFSFFFPLPVTDLNSRLNVSGLNQVFSCCALGCIEREVVALSPAPVFCGTEKDRTQCRERSAEFCRLSR